MSEKMKLLVVEDSPTQAWGLKRVLTQAGYDVSVAFNGVEALKSLSSFSPAIIISDIMMPEMDGYQMCASIKNNPAYREIPVILLTQLTKPNEVLQSLKCRADGFITKPYKPEFLLQTIEDIVKTRAARSQHTEMNEIQIMFQDEIHVIKSDPEQVVDLLFSTFNNALQKNIELEKANEQLLSMHQELKEKKNKLEVSVTQLNQFMGMAAHDLRNPLTVLLGYSEYLMSVQESVTKEENVELLQTIHEHSEFMLKLVNDILDISKIESGKLELEKELIDIDTVIKSSIRLNKVFAQQKEISLTVDRSGQDSRIECDPNKMEQVLNNLISNAIKYSHSGTTITVKTIMNDRYVNVAVIDQGQGIPSEERDKLFEPFEKTSVQGTQGELSTGLGLAIVKKIVDGHGGDIVVSSEVGKGSTFTVMLPRVISGDGEQEYDERTDQRNHQCSHGEYIETAGQINKSVSFSLSFQ